MFNMRMQKIAVKLVATMNIETLTFNLRLFHRAVYVQLIRSNMALDG